MSLKTRYQKDQMSSSSTCGRGQNLIYLVSCVQSHPVHKKQAFYTLPNSYILLWATKKHIKSYTFFQKLITPLNNNLELYFVPGPNHRTLPGLEGRNFFEIW